jgi:hypothetical protein
VFLPGDGGFAPSEPSFSGPQTLRVEPSAIPGALAAFTVAHERVARKVKELTGLDIRPWAKDEVSVQTAVQFTQRSQGGGADAALACLLGYEKQLAEACAALKRSQEQYQRMEGDNSALWGIYD